MPGGAKEKHDFQKRFVHYNIRGEWFNPALEISDFITNNSVQFKVNTVHKLENDEYGLTFAQPLKGHTKRFSSFGVIQSTTIM